MKCSEPYLIAIMGTTASGKSDLAEKLAEKIQAQLINADAFQIYKGLDIGTNKPQNKERYHLIDIKEPTQSYGVGEWIQNVLPLLEKAYNLKQNVIIVGGTGLYIRALLEKWNGLSPCPPLLLREELNTKIKKNGVQALYQQLQSLDPSIAKKVDPQNPVRVMRALEKIIDPHPSFSIHLPPFKTFKFGIEKDLSLLNNDINQRVHLMIEKGWIQEVETLLSQGVSTKDPGMRAIGYEILIQYIKKEISIEKGVESIQIATRQYAKKQRTWLRKEPNIISISPDVKNIYNALMLK